MLIVEQDVDMIRKMKKELSILIYLMQLES